MASDELVQEWASDLHTLPSAEYEAFLRHFAAAVEKEARDAALEEAAKRLKKESAHRKQGLMEESRIYGYALDEAAAVLRALKSSPTAGVIMVDGEETT